MRSHILSMLGALGLLLSPLGVMEASAATSCTAPAVLTAKGSCKIPVASPTRTCGKGYTKGADGKCVRTTATITKQCPAGTQAGTGTSAGKCVKKPTTLTKACSVGQSLVGGKCVKTGTAKSCRINPKAFTTGADGKKTYKCAAPGISTGTKPPTTCVTSDGKSCSTPL